MQFELKTARYQGPIEKLVELIDEKKLSITELSLAEVTADFLSYVETLEARPPAGRAGAKGEGEADTAFAELLADFLVIATRLILIKSKALLPALSLTPEEEEGIRDLEARVRLYQELKNLEPHVKRGWRAAPQMGTRAFLLSEEATFYPPPHLALRDLHAVVGRLAGELERITRPFQKVKGTIIHLKEKIEEIIERVKTRVLSFGDLKKGRSRAEAVVLFLAMLHLVKSQLVRVTQDQRFSDITIAKRGRERDNDYNEKS